MKLEYDKPYTETDLTALGFRREDVISTADYPVYGDEFQRYVMKSNGNGRMMVFTCWNYSHARTVRK